MNPFTSDKPRLLDLFCGAGGGSRGYTDAGFYVVGVDNRHQRHYPYEFVQADALEYMQAVIDMPDLYGYDAIVGSPPCHDHSRLRSLATVNGGTGWMLAATRELLIASGKPWVIENVPGAPMRADYKLCGCMVGLPRLQRERWFETSWGSTQRAVIHNHQLDPVNVTGGGGSSRERARGVVHYKKDWDEAMGIDWMNRDEMTQAIPPAYTRYMGALLKAMI